MVSALMGEFTPRYHAVTSVVCHAYKFGITCSSTLQEKYEKELKDARVRELMYAEREAILDKVRTSSFELQMECYLVCLIFMHYCIFLFTTILVEKLAVFFPYFFLPFPHSFCPSSECIFFLSPDLLWMNV